MPVFGRSASAFQPEQIPLRIWIAAAALFTFTVFAITQRIKRRASGLPLPPGPKGWPLVGSLPEVIRQSSIGAQHLLFGRWAAQYGPLYKVKVGPFTQYMINTDVAAKRLFDGKVAAQTSERPRWIVSNEQICNEWNVLLLNASDPRWKQQRKAAHGTMTSIPRADAGLPALHYESLKFMHDVVSDPSIAASGQKLWNALQRYTYSTFTVQSMGLEIPSSDSPAIEYIHETGKAQILGTLPGFYMVDVFPVLDRLPLALKPWEREARARFQRDCAWVGERLDRIKKMPDRTAVRDSLICRVIEDEKNYGFESELQGAYFALMMTIGAADTSQVSTWSFLEAMMRYPDAQRKGQAAVDAVCGDRIPVFEDLSAIPYVNCLIKETWRWRPPVPLGHPHLVTEDLEYEGMRIPKGSRLHLNAWTLHRDPTRHRNADDFIPERYEKDSTTTMQSINSSDPRDRDHFAFGAGRRICPGYNVAERSLSVSVMRFLWTFDIKVSPDAKLPLDSADFRGLMPGVPGPAMPVKFEVRKGKAELIKKLFAEAQASRTPLMSVD